MRTTNNKLQQRYNTLKHFLNEKQRRLYLGTEAQAIGYGGASEVSRQTGVSRRAIQQGIIELEQEPDFIATARIRKEGGG